MNIAGIKELIARGKVETAIKSIRDGTAGTEWENDAITIANNYRKYKRNVMSGILDSNEERKAYALITQQLLVLLNELIETESDEEISKKKDLKLPSEQKISKKQSIFISYAWGDEKEEGMSREGIVDRLCDSLTQGGYQVIRDKKNLEYKGLISEFMQLIGKGNLVIVVISDKYLKSPYCMFELLEISRNLNFQERIFPVVLGDANIRGLNRAEYIVYWKNKYEEVKEVVNKLGFESISTTKGLGRDLEITKKIYQNSDELISILHDINSLSPELLESNDFEVLKKAIDNRLGALQ